MNPSAVAILIAKLSLLHFEVGALMVPTEHAELRQGSPIVTLTLRQPVVGPLEVEAQTMAEHRPGGPDLVDVQAHVGLRVGPVFVGYHATELEFEDEDGGEKSWAAVQMDWRF